MRRKPWHMSVGGACACFCTMIFAVCAFVPQKIWFVDAQENYYKAYWRNHRKIIERESLVDFFTFDEPSLPEYSDGSCKEDWFGIIDHVAPGVMMTKGRHGDGVKFDGDNDTFYALDTGWASLPDAFSIAFWVNLSPLPASQDIFCTWFPKHIGFLLDRGRLCFVWTSAASVKSVSYHFDKYKEFVHVAVVADRREGRIRMYENGICVAEEDCRDMVSCRWPFVIGKGNLSRNRAPLHGIIDDLAIWNRAISEKELHDIVASSHGLQDHFSSYGRRLSMGMKRSRARVAEKIGRFVAWVSPGIVSRMHWMLEGGVVPKVSIYLTGANLRSLDRAHAKSTRSGGLVPCEFVEAIVAFGGQTMECKMSPTGGTMYYPYTDRPAYALESVRSGMTFPGGYRRLELLPPEKAGWMVPLAISEIRRASDPGHALRRDCTLIELEVNGLKRGVYLMRDVSRMSVSQDDPAEILHYNSGRQPYRQRDAEMEYLSPATMDKATSCLVALLSAESKALLERRLVCAADLLAQDPFSPVPASFRLAAIRERLAQCKRCMQESTLSSLDDVPVSAAMFLGSNLCAWCITDELDFSGFTKLLPHGISATIHSSNTNVLSSSGAVFRPKNHPECATVTVSLESEDGSSRSVPLEFRVLPLSNAVPAVYVWSPIPVGRSHQTDAAVEIFDGHQAGAGGCCFDDFAKIRYRGNSSFLFEKKLMRIKARSAHHWLSDTGTKHLLAINASTDVLRVWNGLAFDLFRSFPRPGETPHCAPHVKVAELFVNGRYWSLIEFAERLDEYLWDDPKCIAFRHRVASPRSPFMRQSRPDVAVIDALDIYLDLENMLASADGSEESLSRIESRLDITSIIDYLILFSLFSNVNGGESDFWMQECLMYNPVSGKYFYIPWDFDDAMRVDVDLIETNLNRLLSGLDPGYNGLVLNRWRQLRATVLATDTVLAKYDDAISDHEPYLIFEHRSWLPALADEADIQKRIQSGRDMLSRRLEKMDRLFSERCGETAARRADKHLSGE